MTLDTSPTPRLSWIAEALRASWGEGRSFHELVERLTTEIAARLPLEALTLAAVMYAPSKRCAAIVAALTCGDTRAVQHAELFGDIAVALDEAGVPRPSEGDLGLLGRVKWLTKAAAEREAVRAHLTMILDALVKALGYGPIDPAPLLERISADRHRTLFLEKQLAETRQQSTETEARLCRELVATRRQRDGVAADLHHERCANQEAAGEAAVLEGKLTEERDAALQRSAEQEQRCALLQRELDEALQRNNETLQRLQGKIDEAWQRGVALEGRIDEARQRGTELERRIDATSQKLEGQSTAVDPLLHELAACGPFHVAELVAQFVLTEAAGWGHNPQVHGALCEIARKIRTADWVPSGDLQERFARCPSGQI